ncbi:MAG TPA: methyltransferase domain-containing protein [Gemmatimonadales bacterium]|nr:methyltransferase domain-containing protein [Gemmatimonadales bacterium]
MAVLLNLYLFSFYHTAPRSAAWITPGPWVERWAFSPLTLGRFSLWRLALVSVLGMFLELLMIRWISSEIRIFAYFKNFVLIACFLGFGLGCYLCRQRINVLALIVPLVALVLLVKLPWYDLRELIARLPTQLGAISEVQAWGVPSLPLNRASLIGLLTAVAVIVPMFALIAFVFIPIGQLVGWYLENASKGIAGYSVNVLGSLAGIMLYTLLCFLFQPPVIWLALAGLMLVWLLWGLPLLRWTALVGLAVCVGLATINPQPDSTVYWSPYQKLTLTPRLENGRVIGYILNTNGDWYQQIIDLSPQFVAAHQRLFANAPVEWNAYNVPYRFAPRPASVLVLGSGMGNDVAAALRNGAGRVVAVEIDPLILQLGRQLHFEKPYSSPRVQQVLDDARSYIQNGQERFDLIVFSLLDSHTNSSHFSNIRIDNYVYTIEALEAAKRLLKPDGVFIVKFQVEVPWIAGRLYGLLETVFGRPPLELQGDQVYLATRRPIGGMFFVTGSDQRIARALADSSVAAYVRARGHIDLEPAPPTTDDWPYFYQHAPGLPATVIVISAVLILVCWFLMGSTGTTGRSIHWHFFFLGAGFLLLEAQIVSKMALLFGTTWVVNSIVISGLLILIVAANLLVGWQPRIPVGWAYAGILASIGVSFALPLERLFLPSLWLKALVATAVLCLPVFFAGIVFIRSFARAGFRGEALGSNLLGALVGGLLESLSMWTGIRSLLVIAALLYLASWVALGVEAPARHALGETPGEARAPA